MRIVDTTCTKCGANLHIDADRKTAFCEYCGAQLLIDDDVQHLQIDNAESAGYAFEKGRQRAQNEAQAQILYDEDKSILIQLGVSNENGVAQFFSYNENSFRKAVEISEGLYVYTNTNTSSKLNLLEKLFGMYNIDLTELGFYLRNTADELENESGTRYEMRDMKKNTDTIYARLHTRLAMPSARHFLLASMRIQKYVFDNSQ